MRSFDEIRNLAADLQRRRSRLLNYMLDVKRAYQADYVVPLGDVSTEPTMPGLTPTLIADTIDEHARRAATVHPMVFSPAIEPDKRTGAKSMERATRRRQILSATYDMNGWKLQRRRYYRHLGAYETASVFIEPDFKNGLPKLRLRDPLETFPESKAMESVEPPSYVAFITRHSGDHLRYYYPNCREEQGGPISAIEGTRLWDVFEWVDYDQLACGLIGPVELDGEHIAQSFATAPWIELRPPVVNRAGICLAVTPQDVSLHTIGNRLNTLMGNTAMQARLMALEMVAMERGVFPDMYAVGDANQMPTLVSGSWKDGRTGQINIVRDARQIGLLNTQPSVMTAQAIDRLERNYRVSSGLSPQFGGENYGSLRTGRAMDSMTAISIDPKIQELHEVTETWMPKINSAILAAYKGWWPDKKYEFFSGWPGDKGVIKFTPSEDIETLWNSVSYAIPGADVVQLTQVLGSMLGADIVSAETFRRKHPWIDEPGWEQDQINQEKLERMVMEGIGQQVITGQMPASVVARIHAKMREDEADLFTAVTEVDDEIRQEQLEAAQAAQAQAAMVPGAPNMVPGLAAGPASANPGMPPEMAGMVGPSGPAMSPTQDMRALLEGAMAAGPG